METFPIDIDNIHIIESNDTKLLYYPPSYSLIEVDDSVLKILKMLKQNEDIGRIASETDYKVDDIMDILSQFNCIFQKNKKQAFPYKEEGKQANRIMLHVSNNCDLRCKYCYANGGNYHLPFSMMNKQTADLFIDFCKNNFDDIKMIVFFGGEPCLNIEIMLYVCNRFKNDFKKGEISYLPLFSIITNGTILNEDLLYLIKNDISHITISIDGNEECNDINRVYPNGKGSFNEIESFIDTVKTNTDAELEYEATYTKQHIALGYKREDVREYLNARFGIPGTVIDEKSMKGAFLESESIDFLPQLFYKVLRAIVFKSPAGNCLISKSNFAVSTLGDIYPCHMDVGNIKNRLGNIKGNNIFNDSIIRENFPLYNLISRENGLCKNCWARYLCDNCPRDVFFNEKEKTYTIKQNQEFCNETKKRIEDILIEITKFRKNEELWKKLILDIKSKKIA